MGQITYQVTSLYMSNVLTSLLITNNQKYKLSSHIVFYSLYPQWPKLLQISI